MAKKREKVKNAWEKPETISQLIEPGKIRARVIDAENGLELVPDIHAVRIHSREYNLLIMEDYLPALGKVDGDVTLLTHEKEISLENIKGFYKLQHNEFTLLIEQQDDEPSADFSAEGTAPKA